MAGLEADIREEIARAGPMTLARFMELALYAPGRGYYETRRPVGRTGDFYTSVSAGPVFGELLAFQFALWFDAMPAAPGRWQIAEAGAHDGTLAADVLRWMRQWRTDIFSELAFTLIEPSPVRRQWQEETLRDFSTTVKWVESAGQIEAEPARGRIIFGNELLDAMPARRLAWNAASRFWDEDRIDWAGGKFLWRRCLIDRELAACAPEVPAELAAVLPDGFAREVSPAAAKWWAGAAATLPPGRGKLLTLDYGYAGDAWHRPERGGGTLRAYENHRLADSVFENIGGRDLTTHVDFSAIEATGIAAGLVTEQFTGQEKFLTQIVAAMEAHPGGFESWTPARVRQLRTLIHPEHLGRAFRALVQSRP